MKKLILKNLFENFEDSQNPAVYLFRRDKVYKKSFSELYTDLCSVVSFFKEKLK